MLFKKEQLHSDISSLPKGQLLDKVTVKLHSKSEIWTEKFCDSECCIYPWSTLLAFRDHTWNNIDWRVPKQLTSYEDSIKSWGAPLHKYETDPLIDMALLSCQLSHGDVLEK